MRTLIALLLLASSALAQNPGPSVTGAGRLPPPCVEPTMTYIWVPASGCSTSSPCATELVSGNNASQTTSGDLPTYSATGGPSSQPALVFNGSSDYLIMNTAIPSGVTAFTLYAVFKPAAPSSNGYDMFDSNVNNSIEFQIANASQGGVAALNEKDIIGTYANRAYPSGNWYAEVATYNNGTTTTNFYAVSGGALAPDGVNTSQAFTFSGTTANLGGDTLTSQYFDGSIAEWGFLNSVNTAGIANWVLCHYGV